MAANLERRQIGEQFRIIDAPRVPERPFTPNRQMINLMGAAVGLALGLGLAVFLEYRDTSFRTDDDVVTALALPVLAVVPRILTSADRRRVRRWRRVLSVLGAACALLFAGAVLAWKLGALSGLL